MKIRLKLFIVLLIVASAATGFQAILAYRTVRENTIESITDQLQSVSQIQENRLNETISNYLDESQLVSSMARLSVLTAELVAEETEESAATSSAQLTQVSDSLNPVQTEIVESLIKAKTSVPGINEISIYTQTGRLLVSTDDQAPVSIDPAVLTPAMNSAYFHEVFKDQNNQLQIRSYSPIITQNDTVGFTEIVFSADRLLNITDDYTGLGETGETVFARRNSAGDAVFLIPLRFDSGAALRRAIPAEQTNTPIIAAFDSERKILTSRDTLDYRGEPVFAVTSYLPSLDWGLVIKIDRAEALNSVNNLSLVFIVTTVLTLVGVTTAALLLSNTFTKTIRNVSTFAEKLMSGDYSARTIVESDDEVGFLAETLNNMAANIEKSYEELEKKVAERTADLQKFKLAVENASDQIIITDADGTILYANHALEKITGFEIDEVLGKKAGSKELWGGQMPREFYKEMWRHLKEDKKDFQHEITNHRKNGQEYTALATISPIVDDTGEVAFFVAIERDISKEKKIDQAKTEFVSLASHQLRTPLTSIRWFVELLNDKKAKLSTEQTEFISKIHTSTVHMIDLVNALLNVSRIELGTFAVDPVPTDIQEIAQSVISELELQIAQKKLKVSHQTTQLPDIPVDPQIFRIVYQNLLTNAVKYTPEGGTITVKHEISGKNVLISVADTGYGIPDAEKDKIFSKLFRAKNVQQRDTEGTGLGLYIVKAIIDHAEGKIWFESQENKGTTFFIELPLTGMPQKEGSKPLEESEHIMANKT